MKKLIASASLVTAGVTGLQAAYAPGLTPMETAKPWSIGATLRGFYDDNYNNAPSNPTTPGVPSKQSSGGIEFGPTFKLNIPMDQTYFGAGLHYSMKYYFDRPQNHLDHLVELTLKADHRISEQYKVSLDDSFVYSVEPELASQTVSFFRRDIEYIRNRARVGFVGQFTELLGFEASYQNQYYDYFDPAFDPANPNGQPLSPYLDRIEHLFDVRATWQVQPHLKGFVGYQYGIFDYTSDALLNPADPLSLRGTDRDNTSHYFYVGAEKAFSSQLNGSVQVGAQYTSWDTLNESDWSPFVDLRGTYTYLPGSYVQVGLTHMRNATDLAGGGTATDVTLDQESTTVFASVNHRITPAVTGSLLGQYQYSSFNGGSFDGKADQFFLVGLNLEYRININWAAEIGYNLDYLNSDIPDRGFTRNRVYGGVRVNF